jgi:PAS domain-containing protein
MASALRTGEPSFDIEILIERPGAAPAIAVVNVEPLFGPNGRIEGAVSSLKDISERRRRRSGWPSAMPCCRRSARAPCSRPRRLYTTDADGRITFVNEAAVEFWGQRPT